ncbi:uncharacterized protein LOC101213559 isoform X2 [Cucumis sativus]|uniref:S1 motif domain-containing protein n=1 Tax=Cucumis sativus TaxID=3659 RepID=A0A0A0KTX2_CUCSA|nr:uncharacterized protein LOC101213559 isoform X2 [Cucumis sativus]KGN53055.1 hypothetical protein Csa_014442 [Cucumis sativus]
MPIFVATIASVSAHSFLSLLASTSDASSTSSSSSSFILPLKSPSKRSSIFPSRVSLSGKPDPIAGVLDTSPESVRRARRSADWKAAREYLDSGFIYEGRIEGSNAGGLLVRFYSLVGFLPFPQLSPSHSCKEPYKSIQDIAKSLIGSLISVKVIQADEKNRKLIFSEKEAARSKFSGQVAVGDVYEGKVGSVEDYGAFVHLRLSDGLYHLTGLVHVSEVSWDLVQDVRDILSEGDEVTVKVINVNKNKSRITLSIRQLEEDPLLETLDKVIPQESSAEPDSFGPKGDSEIIPLPGLETIIEELLQEEGIVDVRVNRQGFEKRVVSQDLQLWLSNAPPVEKKFTLLARAGRQVQEIQLTTSLDQEGIKRALQRVLERVP